MFQWTLHIIETGGYFGIFLLMVLENIFPPIPSEVVIPLAGFASAQGELHIALVILVATCGAVVGAIPWYLLGRLFGVRRLKRLSVRYGRLLTLSPVDIDHAQEWFHCHGQKAVLFGRLIPTIRTLISVPAGLARMKLSTFLLYSFIGSAAWTSILALLGYLLESQYDQVAEYLNPVSNAVVALIVAVYLYRVVTFRTNGSVEKE